METYIETKKTIEGKFKDMYSDTDTLYNFVDLTIKVSKDHIVFFAGFNKTQNNSGWSNCITEKMKDYDSIKIREFVGFLKRWGVKSEVTVNFINYGFYLKGLMPIVCDETFERNNTNV